MIIKLWKKYESNQAAKFIFVGILNIIVGYGAFTFLIFVHWHYALALTTSTILSVAHSYIWNKYFTFRKHAKSFSELARFIGVYCVIYVLNLIVLWILVDLLYFSPVLSQGFAIVALAVCSYIGHKFWSFR